MQKTVLSPLKIRGVFEICFFVALIMSLHWSLLSEANLVSVTFTTTTTTTTAAAVTTPTAAADVTPRPNTNVVSSRPWFILHVGPAKTATTSLQYALTQYAATLANEDNLLYLGQIMLNEQDTSRASSYS